MPALHNLLEPECLLRHFLENPPEGFSTFTLEGGVPAFSAPFDLMTTMEPAVRRKLESLPFASRWRRLLRSDTCFVGTTVSEYAPLPASEDPEAFVGRMTAALAPRFPFLIVKDLPTDPALVGEAACAYSSRVAEACRNAGYLLVEGQALAYVPIDFASTDAFLARMSHARRRDVRRKLRGASRLQVEEIPGGDPRFEDESLVAALHKLYRNVYRQSEIHFDLLTESFFGAVLRDAAGGVVVFTYRAEGELIGFNLCLAGNGMLMDKYVGFAYPQARERNLYAVSWFRNLEYAQSRGFRCYIAGWTDPEVKRSLGARMTMTRHAVYVRNPVLRKVLAPFRRYFESDSRWREGRCRSG